MEWWDFESAEFQPLWVSPVTFHFWRERSFKTYKWYSVPENKTEDRRAGQRFSKRWTKFIEFSYLTWSYAGILLNTGIWWILSPRGCLDNQFFSYEFAFTNKRVKVNFVWIEALAFLRINCHLQYITRQGPRAKKETVQLDPNTDHSVWHPTSCITEATNEVEIKTRHNNKEQKTHSSNRA